MALSPRAYIRVPPDGGGKALVADMMIYMEYASASSHFTIGQRVVGGSSSTTGTVVQSIPLTATTGRIGVHLAFPDIAKDFDVGEQLLVGGNPFAVVSQSELVYVSRNQVVGSNNPNFGQRVDSIGAASVRFSEGSPSFDAFGRMQVSEAIVLGEYRTPFGLDPEKFSYETVGGGSNVYEADSAGVILRTNTASGSKSVRTTNKYHAYQPGSSQLAQMSLSVSHSSQAGTRLRWGYFNEWDGLYFQLDGDATLNVCIRSSVTGSVVDTVIPRSLWNQDPLDGTGDSLLDIDVTMLSLWWIDFGWYGANRVRFGVYDVEGRITCHELENNNVRARAFMRTGRLPLRWEIENLTATASTTEMYCLSGSVKAEGQLDRPVTAYGGADAPTTTITGTGWKSMFGFRPAATYNGLPNRIFVLPTRATAVIRDSSTGAPAYAKLGVFKNPNAVTGAAWVVPPSAAGTSLEFDPVSAGATVTGGRPLGMWMGSGTVEVDLSTVFDYIHSESVALEADGTQTPYYVVAQPLNPAQSVDITIVTNWHEVQ